MRKKNIFVKLIIVLFIIYLGLYISSVSGYYEVKLNKKVALTNEKIEEFEQDVLEGKIVDINTYLENDTHDYSNVFTKGGERVSEAVIKLLTKGFKGTWDALKILFF